MNVSSVVSTAVAAASAWAHAGVQLRLHALQDAANRFRACRGELVTALRSDGHSERTAQLQIDDIFHHTEPERLEHFARQLVRIERTPTGVELVVHRPDGVVLLVTPGNAPDVGVMPLLSILLAGNAVVVRMPERPSAAARIVELAREAVTAAGFAPGLLGLLQGKTRDVLAEAMTIEALRTIVFFGNSSAGAAVAEQAARHAKKLVLELDGSDYMVVWHDADVEQAVSSASAAWRASTQICIAPKQILVHDRVYSRFLDAFVAAIPASASTTVADPERGMLMPVARLAEYMAAFATLERMGTVAAGGYAMSADGNQNPDGPYVAPTVIGLHEEACRDVDVFHNEIFYPLIPVVRFEGPDPGAMERMAACIQASPFGLRVSIWTRSTEVTAFFGKMISGIGLVKFNEAHMKHPNWGSAFGGPTVRSGGPAGENKHFWEATSHRQTISFGACSEEQIAAVVTALGVPAAWDRRCGQSKEAQ